MSLLIWTALSILQQGEAFLPPRPSLITSTPTATSAVAGSNCRARRRPGTQLYGINEWRDQALESKYTLDIYPPSDPLAPQQSASAGVPATIPILPFPFSDILLQGQRTQLNLYEQRFHELFADALDNHCGIVGMGLLAGNGMITTLPLCEVESFTRFGYEEDWVDKGDGMGNGSIFVTIRAVGRAKIAEEGLVQEEPYMKARVVELLDEDVNMEGKGSSIESGGLKEKSSSKLSGESSPIEVASLVAGTIENLMVSLSSMEHKMKDIEEKKKRATSDGSINAAEADAKDDGEDGVMNRRLVNAQLESLFMQDSTDGVDMETKPAGEDESIDEEEDEEDEDEDEFADEDEKLDRLAQYQKAFEDAKEADTFGYVLQSTTAIDNLSQTQTDSSSKKQTTRTPKDLAALSWAAFCTGDKDDIKRDVMKIQALDMVNDLQRLQLAAAMLREEKKKWVAKLALAGIKDIMDEDNEDEELL